MLHNLNKLLKGNSILICFCLDKLNRSDTFIILNKYSRAGAGAYLQFREIRYDNEYIKFARYIIDIVQDLPITMTQSVLNKHFRDLWLSDIFPPHHVQSVLNTLETSVMTVFV